MLNRLYFFIDHDVLPIKIEALKILVKIVKGGLYGIEEVI